MITEQKKSPETPIFIVWKWPWPSYWLWLGPVIDFDLAQLLTLKMAKLGPITDFTAYIYMYIYIERDSQRIIHVITSAGGGWCTHDFMIYPPLRHCQRPPFIKQCWATSTLSELGSPSKGAISTLGTLIHTDMMCNTRLCNKSHDRCAIHHQKTNRKEFRDTIATSIARCEEYSYWALHSALLQESS